MPKQKAKSKKQKPKVINVHNFELKLSEIPKSPIIIEGFPGFGFVSTIVTSYLVDHLNAKPIGSAFSKKLSPLIAIHQNKIINPIEILYDKEHNLLIVQAATTVDGMEWDIADMLLELGRLTKAKEIISIEGVTSMQLEASQPKLFFYTNTPAIESKFLANNIERLNEGIIVGVTGALLLKAESFPVSCIFVESHANIPDNKAAAEVIKFLDAYLGLSIDYKPLLEKAKRVEAKLKQLIQQAMFVANTRKKKHEEIGYAG